MYIRLQVFVFYGFVCIFVFSQKFAEMRARLLESQNQLCTRGAAVTILQVLAYTRGQDGPLAEMSIHLGIALLKGGNETVQKVLYICISDAQITNLCYCTCKNLYIVTLFWPTISL